MLAAILIIFIQVPTVIDGDLTINMSHGRKSGDAVLAVNGEALLHYGKGPRELVPHSMMYDWSTRTAFVTSSYRAYWWRDGELNEEVYRHVQYSTTVGTWGDYRIVFHHDFKRGRGRGGRLVLKSDAQEILIANQTPQQSMAYTLTRIYAGKNALVIIDNIGRGIGYLPLTDDRVETKADENGVTVPAKMVTFPMPHEFREHPVVFDERNPNNNLLFADALEIQHGLYYLCASDGNGYIYDLSNTTSYYLGRVPVEGCPVGVRDGKLLIYNPDDGLIEIDPLALVTN